MQSSEFSSNKLSAYLISMQATSFLSTLLSLKPHHSVMKTDLPLADKKHPFPIFI